MTKFLCVFSVWTLYFFWAIVVGAETLIRSASAVDNNEKEDHEETFAVIGYLPEWRYEGANYRTLSEHLTHLILFSLEPTPNGDIAALDRFPGDDVLEEIRSAASQPKQFARGSSGGGARAMKILVCFGGNGRSHGFSAMVRNDDARARFVASVVKFCAKHQLDGVDYNWEYPGYSFGGGYQSRDDIDADYRGLARLVAETKLAFERSSSSTTVAADTVTVAYYPDTRQERLLKQYGIASSVDYLHSMSYDQGGPHHSSVDFGRQTAQQAKEAGLPLRKVTLGVPFYGRYTGRNGGDWVTYEDIVQKFAPLLSHMDKVVVDDDNGRGSRGLVFNGRDSIRTKVHIAREFGLGGVMIWEAGQDCRIEAVARHGQTHQVTCPEGEKSSLLVAISKAIREPLSPIMGMENEL